jgi:hypothetical protein
LAYEMKPDTGSLFKNERREKDTHAHAKGSALIDGVEYWVDAWTNTTNAGDKYQSLKFKRKDAAQSKPQPTGGSGFDAELDDDVPFATANPALEHRVG